MDRDAFDGLTRLLAASPSRRAALGALLGTGLAGVLGAAEAATKDRKRKRSNGKKGRGKAQLNAQAADCLSPGPGTNIAGCHFQGEDFSGQDLSSSRMVGTNFRRARLVGTNLSSSNAKDAVFREADLTCADLRSSALKGADFRAADLTGANLKSSGGCNGATFNNATTFCGTVMCDGSVRNDDCPGGPPPGACCSAADCPGGQACRNGTCDPCSASCTAGQCCAEGACAAGGTWEQCGANGAACETCAAGEVCAADGGSCEACATQTGGTACDGKFGPGGTDPGAQCGPGGGTACACAERADGSGSVCWGLTVGCQIGVPCETDADCVPLGSGLDRCVKRGACTLDVCNDGQATICVRSCAAGAALRVADAEPPPPGVEIQTLDGPRR
jgi:hypothetical protein